MSSGLRIPVFVQGGSRIFLVTVLVEIAAVDPVSHLYGGLISGNESCTTWSWTQASRLM